MQAAIATTNSRTATDPNVNGSCGSTPNNKDDVNRVPANATPIPKTKPISVNRNPSRGTIPVTELVSPPAPFARRSRGAAGLRSKPGRRKFRAPRERQRVPRTPPAPAPDAPRTSISIWSSKVSTSTTGTLRSTDQTTSRTASARDVRFPLDLTTRLVAFTCMADT
jgi:hypothetical protein